MGLKLEGTNVGLGLGFTNPEFGSFKMSALLLQNTADLAKEAYNKSENNYPKLVDFEGFELQAQQVPSKQAMMGFVYSINKI